MWEFFKRGLLLFHRFVSAFGVRGAQIFCTLYVGRRGKIVTVSLPGGNRAWIRKHTSDALVYRQIFLDREADLTLFPQGASVINKYQAILGRGRKPLVIDCGANTGLSSIFLASLFPQAIVVAVEPSEENFKLLCRNVGRFESVKPIHAGICDVRTHLKIINPNGSPCGFRTVECDESDPEAVASLSVPDILERFPNCDPLLIKIDVEGAERSLFRSNTSWGDTMPLFIIELHDWMFPRGGTSANFLACVAQMRCDFLVQGENVFVFNWAALEEGGDKLTVTDPPALIKGDPL
jgi:FkbM family methyltransferase